MFFLRTELKNGLHALRMTLWASISWSSSHTRVTSEKAGSSLKPLKEEVMFCWKSFHFRHNFSDVIMLRWMEAEYCLKGLACLIKKFGLKIGLKDVYYEFLKKNLKCNVFC